MVFSWVFYAAPPFGQWVDKMRITFHGGVGEIGGNKILVEDGDSRLLLDFGQRMGFESEFFSEFLGVRSKTKLRDKLAIGALPPIHGVYRDDLVRPLGMEEVSGCGYSRVLGPDSEYFRLPVQTCGEYRAGHGRAYADGLLLTHAHLDHTGDIMFLDFGIPMYCSEVTKVLVEAIDEVTTFKSEALESKMSELMASKGGMFPGCPKFKDSRSANFLRRDCVAMEDGQTESVGSFEVKRIAVDHSVPGASSFVISGDGKRILYTGDVRFHGSMGSSVQNYAEAVGGGVDLMLCEGTRVESQSRITEEDVRARISEEVSSADGLVFVDFSWKDTTRYETILEAARASGRQFVINARLAYLLNKLGQWPLPEDVKVFLKRKGSALYSPDDYKSSKHEYGLTVSKDGVQEHSEHYDNGLVAGDVRADPSKYVLMLSFYDLGQIFDLADADGKIPGSRFIRAQCAPFCDDMELDEERFIRWMEQFGIAFTEAEADVPDGCADLGCEKLKRRMARAHVSGHASRPELKEMVAAIGPKVLIPIHTEKPDEFVKMADEIRAGGGPDIAVRIVQLGETVNLD